MPSINHVYRLRIETLSPLCVLSGTRLYEEVDFYIGDDNKTTYVIDSNAALELALQRWIERQPSPEQQQADLLAREEKLRQRQQRNIAEIQRFEQSPPRDPRKAEKEEQRLRTEAQKIKEDLERLRRDQAEFAATGGTGPVVPPELLRSSGVSDLLKSNLLRKDDLADGSPIVRYAYAGRPEVKTGSSEILACVKDPADRLYLPGSSLKGALRSALAWALAPERAGQQLLSYASARDNRQAAKPIETAIFYGQKRRDDRRVSHDLLRDVMRAVHVSDSQPLARSPVLLQVRVFPRGSPITVEAMPDGVTVSAVLRVEQYPFTDRAARDIIDFGDWAQRLQPAALAAIGRQRAQALIAGEQAFFKRHTGAAELSRFYDQLAKRLEQLNGTTAFLIPIGWGSGWRAKTLDERLRGEQREATFVAAVKQYNMKLNRQRSDRFRPGDLFPATRKVIMRNGQPWLPLGWVCVTIET
ncbi:type III-A CRISPR-associated RAMP protein Csm5 [Chloroflexus sp.]|uniref:type III-A CRISPR-associated RAMP protein Csm5 n=1 Tax=Chloroflexus sp. TaxID=1904827 RepID=UPI00298F3215|nr:type III-A CRISPR-associated RAMP protein Csm5 [Chloroflexus sp.]MDW8404968.1 type III-A CRISPR-associated RAMP protein Csm5 [Chloroflexus sp.]